MADEPNDPLGTLPTITKEAGMARRSGHPWPANLTPEEMKQRERLEKRLFGRRRRLTGDDFPPHLD